MPGRILNPTIGTGSLGLPVDHRTMAKTDDGRRQQQAEDQDHGEYDAAAVLTPHHLQSRRTLQIACPPNSSKQTRGRLSKHVAG